MWSLALCRLEAYDRNANFGHDGVQQDDVNMTLPSMTTYRDINTNSQVNKLCNHYH